MSLADPSPTRRPNQRMAEDRRRRQMIDATVAAIADVGFAHATIAEIARRAGVSTGLLAFYFGDKDGLLEATLRDLAATLAASYAEGLRAARDPRGRIEAMIQANLGDRQFDRGIATVWLAFWGQVTVNPRFRRVQRVYERRVVANLTHDLRRLMPAGEARSLAEVTAALIDGLWLRAALAAEAPDAARARRVASRFVDAQLAQRAFALGGG